MAVFFTAHRSENSGQLKIPNLFLPPKRLIRKSRCRLELTFGLEISTGKSRRSCLTLIRQKNCIQIIDGVIFILCSSCCIQNNASEAMPCKLSFAIFKSDSLFAIFRNGYMRKKNNEVLSGDKEWNSGGS